MEKGVIIITGASSGIGLATAQYLDSLGFVVYGLSRSQKENVMFHQISCDITKREDIKKAVDEVVRKENRIDVIINNAGMGVSGAVEYMSEPELRMILDVNVVGLVGMCQESIPHLRKTKGKIINIGSVAGELVIPFQAYYSMTKASVAVVTEAIRMECKSFGISATTVLPGDTKTEFTKNRILPKVEEDQYYQNRIKRSIEKMAKDEEKGVSPLKVAYVIEKIIKKNKPPVQVVVGFQYKLFVFLKRLLPKRLVSYILYKMYAK